MKSPLRYPLVFENAVPPAVLQHVNALIARNLEQFDQNKAGANRKFLKADYVAPEGDEILHHAKKRLAEHYALGDYVVPPKLKDFLGYITEGGCIHPHTDPDLPGKRHVRINVLVKQPEGCVPLIEGIPILVKEGDAWLNLASLCIHATTKVTGPGYRSALSFGYQIDPARGDELYRIHKEWMANARGRQGGSPAASMMPEHYRASVAAGNRGVPDERPATTGD
jgi:hypothetical protein